MENKLIIVVINGHEFTAKHRAPLIRYLSLLGYRVKCLVPKDSEAEAFLKKEIIQQYLGMFQGVVKIFSRKLFKFLNLFRFTVYTPQNF